MNSERRLAHRHGRRALKASLTLGVLLGLFFSTWLPFFITNMAQVIGATLKKKRKKCTKHEVICLFFFLTLLSHGSCFLFFLHSISMRWMLKQCVIYAKERKKNNTWIQVYFCVDQLSRHSSCQAIQRGNGLAFGHYVG